METVYGASPIHSLLDTDFYTFTMMQAVLHQQPNAEVEYKFIVRSRGSLVPYIPEIRAAIDDLAEKAMTEDELRFLGKREYLTPDFIRFLSLFRFNKRYIHVGQEDGQLSIRVRGPWLHTIMFEQPILSLVSEIRNRNKYPDVVMDDVTSRLYEKFDWLQTNVKPEELKLLKVADFATRRRLSFKAQYEMVDIMRRDFPGVFVGTSNVHMAREFNIPALGTMAHQWLMAYQQFGRLKDSQKAALEGWVREYRGLLGIALTDCISSDFFLSDFDLYFAKLFDGLRHDSGDPIVWAEKCIAHYKKLGIDPMSKTLIFSDGLNFEKSVEIMRALKGRINFSFGIGTNLGCDVKGVEPLSIVMKLVEVNGSPVVKFSDDPVKVVCENQSFLHYAADTFGVKIQ